MKRHADPRPTNAYEDDGASEHFTFYQGATLSQRNGEQFRQLREVNREKVAKAHMSRPHKTG